MRNIVEVSKPVSCATNRETLLIEQIADAAYQQNLVVLIVAAISPPLDRLELGKLLFPVTQHVGLDQT